MIARSRWAPRYPSSIAFRRRGTAAANSPEKNVRENYGKKKKVRAAIFLLASSQDVSVFAEEELDEPLFLMTHLK